MTIEHLHTNERLSAAVLYNSLVFLSGQVPGDATDIESQTRQVLDKIDALLLEAGTDKDQILNATLYLKDIGRDFDAMNRIWSTWLSPGKSPSRTALQAELARPNVLVEITIIAARP